MTGVDIDLRVGPDGLPFIELVFNPLEMKIGDRDLYTRFNDLIASGKYLIGYQPSSEWELTCKPYELPKQFQDDLEKGEFDLSKVPIAYKKLQQIITLYPANKEKLMNKKQEENKILEETQS